jgi:hypothetical protein
VVGASLCVVLLTLLLAAPGSTKPPTEGEPPGGGGGGGDGGATVTGSGLEISGNQFTLDGQPFDMTGIRTGSASQSQALTDELISQLDTYKAHDVNTVTVFYMGTSGGNSDPFTVDSSENVKIEADDAARMRQIIEAADARGMVVIVGIFYQRATWSDITTDARVVKAIDAVVDDLKAYDNIILNLANEQNSGAYADKPGNIQSASQILQYIQQVKNRDPNRLVGSGGYKDASNVTIGKAAATDALLFDTGGYEVDREHSGTKYDKYRAAGVPDKPLVNVEMFGGYTADASVQPNTGCYTATGKQLHYKDVDDARVRPGLSVFFHSNKWIQGGATHYELGDSGTCNSTTNSPGMSWWFTYVRDNG